MKQGEILAGVDCDELTYMVAAWIPEWPSSKSYEKGGLEVEPQPVRQVIRCSKLSSNKMVTNGN